MGAERFLLDSSALLTLIEDETGADRVEEILRTQPTLVPWPALVEIHYITQQERGIEEAEQRFAVIQQLPVEILWQSDEKVLRSASGFKARHRISFADALMAGFAVANQAVLVHKDPEFEALTADVRLEGLPYKSGSARA